MISKLLEINQYDIEEELQGVHKILTTTKNNGENTIGSSIIDCEAYLITTKALQ